MAQSGTAPAKAEGIAPVAEPRRLAINFVLLSGGEFTAKLLTFASFSYLARTMGPWNYGILEFVLAVMVFFTIPVDLGLGSYGAREVAKDPSSAPRLLHEITGLRLILALCSVAALAVFVQVIHKPQSFKTLLMWYGVSLLANPYLLQWVFQAHDRMHWVGLASIVRQCVFASLIFLFCTKPAHLVRIGYIECASVAAVALVSVFITRGRMRLAWPWPELRWSRLWVHMREAMPIGATEVAWAFMWYFCTVVLGMIFSDASLGWFGASHRVLMALHTFVWLYFFNMLPSISRCVAWPPSHLLKLMDHSMRLAAWVSLFAAACLTAVAPQLLVMVYGENFRDAWRSFSILAWMLPVAMVSGHHRYILLAYNQQKRLFWCVAASAVTAMGLSLILVPRYSGPGAAAALLCANVLNLVLVYVSVRQLVVRVPIRRQMMMPLIALAGATVLYVAFVQWNFWAAVAVSALFYVWMAIRIDGRRLFSFVQTVIRKPATQAA
jgi:O-antigen/teichoic acid export membrane protein